MADWIQSWRFPALRQRTGSAVLDVSEGVNRPGGPQAVNPPVEKTPPSHRAPRPTILPVYCRHAGKHPGRSETTLQNTSMKFVCSATLLRWAAAPPWICPTAIMAVTTRSTIAKSENAVPPSMVCLPLRGDPSERPVDPELSGKGLHRPWTRVPVPSVAVHDLRAAIAGRGSSCRQDLATVGRVL